MKKETQISLLITVLVSISVIFISYINMGRTDRNWGEHGLFALYAGAFEVMIGIGLMLFERTRDFGTGVLIGALFTLLAGGSICTGVIKF